MNPAVWSKQYQKDRAARLAAAKNDRGIELYQVLLDVADTKRPDFEPWCDELMVAQGVVIVAESTAPGGKVIDGYTDDVHKVVCDIVLNYKPDKKKTAAKEETPQPQAVNNAFQHAVNSGKWTHENVQVVVEAAVKWGVTQEKIDAIVAEQKAGARDIKELAKLLNEALFEPYGGSQNWVSMSGEQQEAIDEGKHQLKIETGPGAEEMERQMEAHEAMYGHEEAEREAREEEERADAEDIVDADEVEEELDPKTTATTVADPATTVSAATESLVLTSTESKELVLNGDQWQEVNNAIANPDANNQALKATLCDDPDHDDNFPCFSCGYEPPEEMEAASKQGAADGDQEAAASAENDGAASQTFEDTDFSADTDTGEVEDLPGIMQFLQWSEYPVLSDDPTEEEFRAFRAKCDQVADIVATCMEKAKRYEEQGKRRAKKQRSRAEYYLSFAKPMLVQLGNRAIGRVMSGAKKGRFRQRYVDLDSARVTFPALKGGWTITDKEALKKSLDGLLYLLNTVDPKDDEKLREHCDAAAQLIDKAEAFYDVSFDAAKVKTFLNAHGNKLNLAGVSQVAGSDVLSDVKVEKPKADEKGEEDTEADEAA